MADVTCFWSFLSNQNLDFLHVSPIMGPQTVLAGHDATIEDLILHQSLLDFIHPDERLLAKQDLSTFLQRKTLAGAVTRCRLRSFDSIAKRGAYPSQFDDDKASTWNIVDMVMYIVTENVILAFFHNQDDCQKHSTCGESNFTPKDAGQLLTVLQTHQPLRSDIITTPMSNSSSISSSSSTTKGDSNSSVDRVLQVYDKRSKQRLLSWPPSDQYYNPEDGQHLSTSTSTPSHDPSSLSSSLSVQQLHQYHSRIHDRSSCMQHIHSRSVIPHPTSQSPTIGQSSSHADSVPPTYCQLERIIISYGCIIFYSFQINYPQPTGPIHHIQRARDCDTSENWKLPDVGLPSIITHNSSYSMSPNTPPIESQYHKYPQLPPYHTHHHHVPTPIYQQKKQNKRCTRCGTNVSPEWRRGPTGHKTLCNACGLRYSRLMSKKHSINSTVPRRYS